jgi:hypothetical protein
MILKAAMDKYKDEVKYYWLEEVSKGNVIG